MGEGDVFREEGQTGAELGFSLNASLGRRVAARP